MKEESKKLIAKMKNKETKEEKINSLNDNSEYGRKIQNIARKVIKNSESQKLTLRSGLAVAIKRIIWFQLLFFNLIVLLIVSSVTLKIPFFKSINTELAIELFEFLKYYISATIVELLGMLAFILHYVFSPHKLLEILKKNK